jgi:hypothetical protein
MIKRGLRQKEAIFEFTGDDFVVRAYHKSKFRAGFKERIDLREFDVLELSLIDLVFQIL